MDSEYEVVSVTAHCSNVENTSIIQPSPGSVNTITDSKINDFHNQHIANTQYDSVDDMNVMPLRGGDLNRVTVIFMNKKIYIDNKIKNMDTFIKNFLNNRVFRKDHLLEIINNNISSIYIIRGHYKNRYIKIH